MSRSSSGNENRLARLRNPFQDAAVGSPWDDSVPDVREIHAGVFERLLRCVEERRAGHFHRPVLLFGEAGSGKTHLLRRLRLAIENGNEPLIPFCWVRMQTSPSMMWRHLRRRVAVDLWQHRVRGEPQLDRLLPSVLPRLAALEDRDLAVALEHLAHGRFVRDARAWLEGVRLPDEALAAMGLASPDDTDELLEDQSRSVLRCLTELFHPVPILLCLDQLEALQAHPGDRAGLFAIGRLIEALHDEFRNVVVIACAQTGLLRALEENISLAAQHRYERMELQGLGRDQVAALVGARLRTVGELEALRPAGAPELWPMDLSRLDSFLTRPEQLTPRRVIFECAEMFRQAQNLPAGPHDLNSYLRERHKALRESAARELTADESSAILSDALAKLLRLRSAQVQRDELPCGIEHRVIGSDGRRTLIAVVNEGNRSLWRKLDRVANAWDPATENLTLVRDDLRPAPDTEKTSQRWNRLRERGARVINPSREALVALDAARRLLADAQSGDLSFLGGRVEVSSVEDWIRGNLTPAASDLLDTLTGGETRARFAALPDRVAAVLAVSKLAPVSEIAAAVEHSPREVEECARQNPDYFGFLEGPVPVVFQRIAPAG